MQMMELIPDCEYTSVDEAAGIIILIHKKIQNRLSSSGKSPLGMKWQDQIYAGHHPEQFGLHSVPKIFMQRWMV